MVAAFTRSAPACTSPLAGHLQTPLVNMGITLPAAEEGVLVSGRYILGKTIGAGGLAYVRSAIDRILNRTVAVKFMHPGLRKSAPDVKRVRLEAIVAASIVHPNVCATLDAGTLPDGSPFVVMEQLEGMALDALFATRPLTAIEALDIAIQTLTGLTAAHALGILHRDVKPANIFCVGGGRTGERVLVKVLDFGTAHVASSSCEREELTPTGLLVGTPHYIAPEHANGLRDLDERVDVYAAGTVLYEMLASRRAFAGATFGEVLRNVKEGALTPLRQVRTDLPDALTRAVARAMSVDRSFRFASAADFRDALLGVWQTMTGQPWTPPWMLVGASARPSNPRIPLAASTSTPPPARPATPVPPPLHANPHHSSGQYASGQQLASGHPSGSIPAVPPITATLPVELLPREFAAVRADRG